MILMGKNTPPSSEIGARHHSAAAAAAAAATPSRYISGRERGTRTRFYRAQRTPRDMKVKSLAAAAASFLFRGALSSSSL